MAIRLSDIPEPSAPPGRSVRRLSEIPEEAPRPAPLESPAARVLFPGVGQALGTAAGLGLGAATGGIGAGAGALVGATTGAAGGESIRQLLSSFFGGPTPRTVMEAARGPLREASVAAMGEATGPALSALGRGAKTLGTKLIVTGGHALTGVAPEAILRAVERGPSKVVRQEFFQPGVPSTLRDQVARGLSKLRTEEEGAYQTAREAFAPLLKQTTVDPVEILKSYTQKLQQAGVLDAQGQPIPSFLTAELAKTTTTTNRRLLRILRQVSAHRQGIPADRLEQLRREIDDLVAFDPNAIRPITEKGRALLMGLRTSIKEALDTAVPELAKANARYHQFREVYDAVQPRLTDARIEPTLRSLLTSRNTYARRALSAADALVPPAQQFMPQALDFSAGTEFAKPTYLRRLFGLGVGATTGGPLGAGLFLLGTAPRALGAALRGGEGLARPMIKAGAAVQRLPGRRMATSTGASTLIRMMLPSESPSP